MEALSRGRYYASLGPEFLDLTVEEGRIRVRHLSRRLHRSGLGAGARGARLRPARGDHHLHGVRLAEGPLLPGGGHRRGGEDGLVEPGAAGPSVGHAAPRPLRPARPQPAPVPRGRPRCASLTDASDLNRWLSESATRLTGEPPSAGSCASEGASPRVPRRRRHGVGVSSQDTRQRRGVPELRVSRLLLLRVHKGLLAGLADQLSIVALYQRRPPRPPPPPKPPPPACAASAATAFAARTGLVHGQPRVR